MQAAFVQAARQFLLQDIDIPTPDPHDVVIRVRAAGICGSDLHFHRTSKRNSTPRFAGGHEVSGEVVEVGTQATLKVGTRVAVEPIIGCEQCSFCLEGKGHLCSSLRHRALGFAEFAVVPEHKAYPLSSSLSFEAGAMIDGTAVALHALQRVPPTSADTVIIVGDGTIALLLIQLLRPYKPRYIGVIGRHPNNLQLIRNYTAP